MTKKEKEKLNDIKRWFHISKEMEKENPNDIYRQGFEDGKQLAYIAVIELFMTKKERNNMYEWLWDI